MRKQTITIPLSIWTILLPSVIGISAGLSLLWLSWTIFLSAPGIPAVPEPGPRVNLSADNIDLLLATALQHQAEPERTLQITVNESDRKNLK